MTSSVQTYRKGHLCNAAEEHLQQGEEEEARVELTLSNAVGVQVGPQEQSGSNECHYAGLQSICDCCLHTTWSLQGDVMMLFCHASCQRVMLCMPCIFEPCESLQNRTQAVRAVQLSISQHAYGMTAPNAALHLQPMTA